MKRGMGYCQEADCGNPDGIFHYRGQADRSEMPRAGEIILSFDDDLALFRQRLQQLSAR